MDLRSERILKWAGLLLCAGLCLEVVLAVLIGTEPPELWGSTSQLVLVVGLVAILSFAAAFAWVMGPGLSHARPRTIVVLLLWMTLLSTIVQSDLGYVVAMTLPCVLRRRIALAWLVIWSAIEVPFVVFYVRTYAEASGVTPTASVLVLMLAAVPQLIWQLWAFTIGLVASTEAQGRRKLVAAQAQLADRSRLEERVQLARELHDTIGHHLAALNVQLELARHLTDGAARDAVIKAHDTGRSLLGDVREVVSSWRADVQIDLIASLARLASSIPDPEIVVTVQPGLRVDQPDLANALLRCAQEAVTNSIRHGDARHVWLELARDDGWLRLTVRDDGRGQAEIAVGNGLRGIQERADALGGRVRLDTPAGGGFAVAMQLPEAR